MNGTNITMNATNVAMTERILNVGTRPRVSLYFFIKRIFDIIVGLIGILFFVPIFIAVKIAYVLSGDFYPIFYKQKRVGMYGKPIYIYKLRTMIPNADEVLKKLMETDEAIREEYTKYKKLDNDPRITKIGDFLRKTSLDEFPQFINIFIGNMSFVGNRPEIWRDYAEMGKYRDMVVATKPGLTGLWQVTGRSDTTFEERLIIGTNYSRKCSLKMDIRIIFETFKVVLKKEGAK